MKVPALNLAGWYDVFLNGSVENFVGMRKSGGSEAAASGQKLVIRPYIHIPWVTKSGDVDFGPEADNRTLDQQIRWFDYWLKGKSNGVDKDPAVRVFVMGANTWREAEDWPIPGTRFTNYYLRSQGQANSMYGNGQLTTEPPPPTSRQTALFTIRPTPSPAKVATRAASTRSRRSDLTTRAMSRSARTSSCTRLRR